MNAAVHKSFLEGMSNVAATVSIVATDGPSGKAGVTVSAMTSVSADTDKPVLLICVNEKSSGAAAILANGVFSVNILRDDQSFVSDTFAGRFGDKGEAKFACADWSAGATGAPLLDDALVGFDCRLLRRDKVGHHHVLFGEVIDIREGDLGRALIYSNRSYATPLSLLQNKPCCDDTLSNRLSISCVSSFAPLYLPEILRKCQDERPDLRVDVIEGDQWQVANMVENGQCDAALVYDKQLPAGLEAERLTTLHPYVLLSADHPLASAEAIDLADLADDAFIKLDQPVSRDFGLQVHQTAGVTPSRTLNASTFEMVRSLVGRGFGYSILITKPSCEHSYSGQRLVSLPIKHETPTISICFATRRGAAPTPDIEDFGRFSHKTMKTAAGVS